MSQNVTVRRSDRYPVGTVVSVYSGGPERGMRGDSKPPGTALTTATVGADGSLRIPNLPDGRYTLWAEVAGVHVVSGVCAERYAPPAGTLRQRVAERRTAAGV